MTKTMQPDPTAYHRDQLPEFEDDWWHFDKKRQRTAALQDPSESPIRRHLAKRLGVRLSSAALLRYLASADSISALPSQQSTRIILSTAAYEYFITGN